MVLYRRLGSSLGPVRGLNRRLSAVSRDLIDRAASESRGLQSSVWSAIIPLFFIVLLSGCGGLAVTSKSALVATPAMIAFGNVAVGQSATVKVTIQNQGVATVEIEDLSVSGATFSIAGTTSYPITLPAGASVSVELQFTPTASGSAAEPLMITSSLSTDPTSIAQVTGTGVTSSTGGPKKVALSWNAPVSSNSVIVGYYIFRSANGAAYQLLNSTVNQGTSYTDAAAQSGSVYDYYVESVDSTGASSAPSNSASVTVP